MSSGRALAGDARYRRLFAARTISNMGNGIMPIALAFGILGLPEGSPTALSLVLAAQAVPLVLMLPLSFRQVSVLHRSGESMMGDLRQGWRVFISFRWVVVIVVAFSFIVMVLRGAEEVMGPVLALQEYGGARGWAVVLGMQSLGLLLGALAASRVRVRRPMLFGMLILLTLPVWLVSLALALPLWAVSLGSFAWGISIELFAVLWFTALHRNIPREALSRVGAYDAMGSMMFGPIGLALAGPLVTVVGLEAGFLIAAGIAGVAILAALASRSVREQRS